MKQPSDKLDDKQLGLFEIKEVVGHNARWLILLETVQIYSVFYISLLESHNDQESKWLRQM